MLKPSVDDFVCIPISRLINSFVFDAPLGLVVEDLGKGSFLRDNKYNVLEI